MYIVFPVLARSTDELLYLLPCPLQSGLEPHWGTVAGTLERQKPQGHILLPL